MTSVTTLAVSVLLGCAFGVGVWLMLAVTPRLGAPSLERRIGPYVRDVTDAVGVTAWAPPTADVRALWQQLQGRVGRTFGGSETIARRLRQAGWTTDSAGFRGRQLAWALVGLAVGGATVVAIALSGRFWTGAIVLPVAGAAAGVILCDAQLAWAARRRVARLQEELPTVLEFLSLCLSAGEGILDALRRVGELGVGELTGELRALTLAVSTGTPLPEALGRLGRKLEIPAVSRSLDHLIAAIDRGAPLAQVLQAQAQDAREDAKRSLIELAGRKEIYMLIPLVFGVLPLSVLFAIFPGIVMLRLGI